MEFPGGSVGKVPGTVTAVAQVAGVVKVCSLAPGLLHAPFAAKKKKKELHCLYLAKTDIFHLSFYCLYLFMSINCISLI